MPTRVGPMPVAPAKVVQPTPVNLEQELRPIVRALVEAAFTPLERRLRDLQTRLDELERRPAPAPVVMAAPAPAPSFARAYAPSHPNPVAGPILNVAAIERSVKLDSELGVFDGRRRRLRLALAVAFGLIVLFGGLFAALAESYTHAHP